MKIAGQYELDISLVSNSSVFPKRINDIFRSNKIASKEKNNIASPPEKKEIVAPKFKKSTSHKENKIHIVYKVDSELTVFDPGNNLFPYIKVRNLFFWYCKPRIVSYTNNYNFLI